MSRRRASDPTVGIRITIPRSVADKIEEQLSFSESRSRWITSACRLKLDEVTVGETYSTRRLMAILHARDDIDETLKIHLEARLTSSSS